MADVKEKKYFSAEGEAQGQLDADSAAFAISPNSWVNRMDCRVGSTDKGVIGTDESIGGTLAIGEQEAGYHELGSVEDVVRNGIVTFYVHTLTKHKIEYYDRNTDTTYLCIRSAQIDGGLNFSKYHPIHSAKIVGDILYWTDDYNEPKKLNYIAAVKMNNPSFDTDVIPYTSPLEEEVPYLIRKPPAIQLLWQKLTTPSITVNNVADFAGQFAWRYLFRDREKSVLSPISVFVNYNNPGNTSNLIRIIAPVTEHINQDVQQVDFCVRYGNTGNFFVIRSWNKKIAADAAAIALHNTGVPGLVYFFYNDKIGLALDAAYSVKPFDSVPIKSRGLETGLSRLFLGNNLSSFNTPVLSSMALILNSTSTSTPFQNPMFKSGSDYKLGVIFRDRFKRVIGNVVTNENLRVQIPDRDYNFNTYYTSISVTFSGASAADEIPIEAYYYEVVVTKNLRTRFFVQAKSGGMKYAIKDAVTSAITYQDTYTASAYGIAMDLSLLNAEGMGYLFDPESNDIARIYKLGDATVYNSAVLGLDGNYVLVQLQDLGSFVTQPSVIFEIYTPYKEVGNDPFFTIGVNTLVANPGTPSRNYTSGATVNGDTYLYGRFAASGSYKAENMASNPKFWKQWLGNWGEVNIALFSKQVRKRTAVQWSNVLVEGTETNGLSSFDALDEKILPLDMGELNKLQQTSKVEQQGNIMLAIGSDETASLYLGEVQVVGADRNAFLASSPNVIGTVNILKGNFGTIDPTTVTEYRGNVYWLDRSNGRVIQYSVNGLFPISNYKMTRFWKNWCEKFSSLTQDEIFALGGRAFVFFKVDPNHDELLISIPKLSDIPPKGYLPDYPSTIYPFDPLDYQGKTMVYDLKGNRWMGSYSFYAEGFASLQNQLYSYSNAQMYIHNQYDNQCNYYGVQYKPKIMFVSNMAPSNPKLYHNTAIESNIPPSLMYFYNNYPVQQSSDLVDFSFRNVEGNWCATILRNKLVPTAEGFNTDGLLTGEVMRNVAMFIMLEFTVSGSNPLELKFVDINFIPSIGNNTV